MSGAVRALFAGLLCAWGGSAQPVRVGVFTLFRAHDLTITANGSVIAVETSGNRVLLEGRQSATLAAGGRVMASGGGETSFTLAIPGKIRRTFHGTLEVQQKNGWLQPVVTMDLEEAVASAVVSESPPGTPFEALKAQAVATRSYYSASPSRHDRFDFCDTTHCQFLRALPAEDSLAWKASAATRGLVLTYEGKVFPAMFSARCGGETRTLGSSGESYPYFAVRCEYCARHQPGIIEGHGLGLCQRGAMGMAASGAGFREILTHYYPRTAVR